MPSTDQMRKSALHPGYPRCCKKCCTCWAAVFQPACIRRCSRGSAGRRACTGHACAAWVAEAARRHVGTDTAGGPACTCQACAALVGEAARRHVGTYTGDRIATRGARDCKLSAHHVHGRTCPAWQSFCRSLGVRRTCAGAGGDLHVPACAAELPAARLRQPSELRVLSPSDRACVCGLERGLHRPQKVVSDTPVSPCTWPVECTSPGPSAAPAAPAA